jgi:hypothetical protein
MTRLPPVMRGQSFIVCYPPFAQGKVRRCIAPGEEPRIFVQASCFRPESMGELSEHFGGMFGRVRGGNGFEIWPVKKLASIA